MKATDLDGFPAPASPLSENHFGRRPLDANLRAVPPARDVGKPPEDEVGLTALRQIRYTAWLLGRAVHRQRERLEPDRLQRVAGELGLDDDAVVASTPPRIGTVREVSTRQS